MVLIKKYENRRLYDTTNSRYVNLDEVAQMLQRGEDVQVVDATTGEDITRLILTQIIVEDAKATNSAFPLDVLRQMVIASGRAGQEATLKYMEAILDFYQNTYRLISPAAKPFGFYPPEPEGHSGAAGVPQAGKGDPAAHGSETPQPAKPANEEVYEMKRRLAELEEMVAKLGPKNSARKKTSPLHRRPRKVL
jgi:polyhydroxyalkanoate synthesis repressor PhaR